MNLIDKKIAILKRALELIEDGDESFVCFAIKRAACEYRVSRMWQSDAKLGAEMAQQVQDNLRAACIERVSSPPALEMLWAGSVVVLEQYVETFDSTWSQDRKGMKATRIAWVQHMIQQLEESRETA